jgi:hypothetical protein
MFGFRSSWNSTVWIFLDGAVDSFTRLPALFVCV